MTASRAAAISLTALLALAGCGGGGSHAGPPAAPLAAKDAASQTAPVTFTFIIPKTDASSKARSAQAGGRQARWITAATQAITVSLTAVGDPVTHNPVTPPGGLPQTTTFTVSATNQNPNTPGQCGTDPTNANNIQCTEQVSLPVGFDSLTISTFDGPPNGVIAPKMISQQRVVASVQQGANTFSYTLDANAGTFTITNASGPLSSGCSGNTAGGGGTIAGATDVSGSCMATVGSAGTATFPVVLSDAHGTVVPLGAPGRSVVSATSDNTANFTVSYTGTTLSVTPHTANGRARITVTATPANTSGASPGDGLSPVSITFTVRTIPPVSFKTRTATGLPRQNGVAGVINNQIILAGGATKPGASYVVTGSTQLYDIGTATWSTRANMGVPRYRAAGAVLNNLFWVSGGLDSGGNVTGTVESYNPIPASVPPAPPNGGDTWTAFHDLITSREAHGMATVGTHLVACGGLNAVLALTGACEYYDPDTDTWISSAAMPTPRLEFAIGVLNGSIYAVGGQAAGGVSNVVQRYDFATDSWTALAPYPVALKLLHAAAINGQLYVTGGFDGSNPTNVTYYYDPATNSWTLGPPMPLASNLTETSAQGVNAMYIIGLGANRDQLVELSSP